VTEYDNLFSSLRLGIGVAHVANLVHDQQEVEKNTLLEALTEYSTLLKALPGLSLQYRSRKAVLQGNKANPKATAAELAEHERLCDNTTSIVLAEPVNRLPLNNTLAHHKWHAYSLVMA